MKTVLYPRGLIVFVPDHCFFFTIAPHYLKSPDSSDGYALAFLSSGPDFEPCSRRNLFNRKRGTIAHSLSLSSPIDPIWLNKC